MKTILAELDRMATKGQLGKGKFFEVVAAMLSAACGDSVAPPEPTSVPTSLRVTPTVLSLELGETGQLSASIRDQFGAEMFQSVTWSSSQPSIASVGPGGLVEAVSSGTPFRLWHARPGAGGTSE
jgi:hypothetical protein